MRFSFVLALAVGALLDGCSLGPVLPNGCDKFAMSESRQLMCESKYVPGWSKHTETATGPEAQCRRTIGGVECYTPAP